MEDPVSKTGTASKVSMTVSERSMYVLEDMAGEYNDERTRIVEVELVNGPSRVNSYVDRREAFSLWYE